MRGLDLHRLLKSAKLKNLRLGKVQRSGDVFVFETTGKHKFLIVREGGFYPSDYAPRGEADGFSMYLRKYVSGKIIESASQYKLDRIITLSFGDSSLVLELFGKLNLIYLEEGVVQNFLRRSKRFRKGGPYTPPESVNYLKLGKEEFEELVEGKTKRELAGILGIGSLIEDVYGEPEEMRQNLIRLSEEPLTPKDVEAVFKESDKENLKEEKEKKLNAERIKISKSIEKIKGKIEKYEKRSGELKTAGKIVMGSLPEYDKLILDALKRGQKRIKVSLPKN